MFMEMQFKQTVHCNLFCVATFIAYQVFVHDLIIAFDY